jgi:hypothetical protein
MRARARLPHLLPQGNTSLWKTATGRLPECVCGNCYEETHASASPNEQGARAIDVFPRPPVSQAMVSIDARVVFQPIHLSSPAARVRGGSSLGR